MRLADGNPMTKTLMPTLICGVAASVRATPGRTRVAAVPRAPALGTGPAAAALAGVAAGTLRRPIGWPLAWAAQVAGILLGLLTPWMFAVGGGFAALFLVEFILGKKIESRQ